MVSSIGGGGGGGGGGSGGDPAGGGAGRVYTLKFVLAGSRGVGKTQLASLFHKKPGGGGYPSVGMQFATRTVRYAERSSVRAQVRASRPFFSSRFASFSAGSGASRSCLDAGVHRQLLFLPSSGVVVTIFQLLLQ